MQKKWVLITNVVVLIIVTIFIAFMVLNFLEDPTPESVEEDCIEVNKVTSFVYDSCYDAFTKTIFLEVHRSYDQYKLKGFEFSFFDYSERSYDITDVPMTNGSKAYRISAEKNP